MKRLLFSAWLASALLLTGLANVSAAPIVTQTRAFTYQGQLNAGGTLPTGPYQFTFTLYDAATSGAVVAGTSPIQQEIQVVNGVFTTDLNFGQVFNGKQYWLEIKVGSTTGNEEALAERQPINTVPIAQYALNSPAGANVGLLQFSTGIILSGPTVVSAAPVLMGFGNHTVEVIDGSGESTFPPEAAGFSFPVPFAGTIQDLQVSADLLVASVVAINTVGLKYDFTVYRASSVPNDGTDHPAAPFVSTPLTSSLRFGFPNSVVTPGTFRTSTNANLATPIAVAAGDRIGIRIRTDVTTDASAADITQLSFSATLSYTPVVP